MIRKTWLFLLLIGSLLIWGCSEGPLPEAKKNTGEKINIVTTIGMIGDAVKNIGGERVTVHSLMGPGVDPHLYKASEGDVARLSKAQIIFYNGLHLEAKMTDIFERMQRTRKTVAVTDSIDRGRLLAAVGYAQAYDPHVWFDVSLWMKAAEKIRDELKIFDPDGAAYYDEEAKKYLDKLESLNRYVKDKADSLEVQKRVLVTAHDAFRYFGQAYGFEVLGLQGISTESEAGTADVQKLAALIAERKIRAIFVESSIPERNIKAVQEAVMARGWKVEIGGSLFSDAMGNPDTKEGTYLGMVQYNVNTIVDALKGEAN